MEEQELPWSVIDTFFRDNPVSLVQHQLSSYNDFYKNGIYRIIKENNPITLFKKEDEDSNDYKHRADIYIGGKNGDKLYFGKPIIYDVDDSTGTVTERPHFMYPNEARLRNMTYGATIHYDADIEYTYTESDGTISKNTVTLSKILLGRFPIMLMSDMCILKKMAPRARFNMGECRNDKGGYFIIEGKEKVIIAQEKFADNMLYVKDKGNELYSHIAKIRSVSEDTSKQVRTLSVSIVKQDSKYTNGQIVVAVPNVRKPVPLFILMRALGVVSDKEIVRYCLLDLDKYSHYMEYLIPSVHDAGTFFTQEMCLNYIALLTKHKTIPSVIDILMNYFLPHVGELNFQEKAYFLGYMVKELLMVYSGEKKATDRDNFKYKRIEVCGELLRDLFREYYKIQHNLILERLDRTARTSNFNSMEEWSSLVTNASFADEAGVRQRDRKRLVRAVEEGFRKAFKGNWGSEAHTKRDGVVQDLNRLSFNSFLSHLRKINLPLDASAKVVGPRMLHPSQWGIIDPVDTPDGGNIGLHKHMAIAAHISSGCSADPLTKWIANHLSFKKLTEADPAYLAMTTKVMINGNWIGNTPEPEKSLAHMKEYKRLGLIPVQTSIHWHVETDTIYVYTDSGRLYRPIYYVDQKSQTPSYKRDGVFDKMVDGTATWEEMLTGFAKKQDEAFNMNKCKVYDSPKALYDVDDIGKLKSVSAPLEFIDSAEEETALIALDAKQLGKSKYTHLEIHPSLMLGVMGNQIVFPENNQLPRDLFSCGQSKQGVSVYHSNFHNRIDKAGMVLNYGQIPLVKSRYMEYLNQEQHPYGENLIVAIMCYGGYNTEDAILFNGGSVARGMLRTTYFNMYEAFEKTEDIGGQSVDTRFANIQDNDVIGTKPGYDYGYLDEYGLIKEGTPLDDKKVVIGRITSNLDNPEVGLDSSVFPKKGQKGFVDKTFITEETEGKRLAKIRIREERIPAIGDKFCSRCGQKGTCGIIIEEKDMPFTAQGIRPDIIINPHALPSRMTIGQLVECVMGKACSLYGGFGDCTAFANKGPKQKQFGDMLLKMGFHSSGNEQLYNGMTGEALEMSIFMGPTYYMRLKQMVKDKINYRARGPRTALTRQTVQGRANDGGLRVGEMERDGMIGHGLSAFLEESLMVRGDEYYMAICNTTGTIAVYNQSRDIFLSPFADGPLEFKEGLDGNLNLENVSKFGKSFSIVRVPYALKLLMQELQTMNVQMRIITEANVDQLTALDGARELKLRLGMPESAPFDAAISELKESLRADSSSMEPTYIPPEGRELRDGELIQEQPVDEEMYDDFGRPFYGDEEDEMPYPAQPQQQQLQEIDMGEMPLDGQIDMPYQGEQIYQAAPQGEVQVPAQGQTQDMVTVVAPGMEGQPGTPAQLQSQAPRRNIIRTDGPVFESAGFLGGAKQQQQPQQPQQAGVEGQTLNININVPQGSTSDSQSGTPGQTAGSIGEEAAKAEEQAVDAVNDIVKSSKEEVHTISVLTETDIGKPKDGVLTAMADGESQDKKSVSFADGGSDNSSSSGERKSIVLEN